MKDVQKIFQAKKYGIIIIYFNFIIILHLILNLIRYSSSPPSPQSEEQSEQIKNNNQTSNSDQSQEVHNVFSWVGYVVALVLLNSILTIKCQAIKERQYYWIKQALLFITLLLVIIELNLSESRDNNIFSKNYQNSTLYCSVKYQTGQISLFSLISLVEVIPFQLILILINQIYFLFIRQEIYASNYSDQIIFFAVYFASIFAFISVQRLQDKVFQTYTLNSHLPSNNQVNDIRKKWNNLSNIFQNSQQLIKKNTQSMIENNQEIENDLKYEENCTLRQNLQSRDTQNNFSSRRPLFHRNQFQRETMSQTDEFSVNHLKKDYEDHEAICQSRTATYGMKISNETHNFNQNQFCPIHHRDETFSKSRNCKDNSEVYEQEKECCMEGMVQNCKERNSQRQNQLNIQKLKKEQQENSQCYDSDMTFNLQNSQRNFISSANIHRTRKISHFKEETKPESSTILEFNQISKPSSSLTQIEYVQQKQQQQQSQQYLLQQKQYQYNLSSPIIHNQPSSNSNINNCLSIENYNYSSCNSIFPNNFNNTTLSKQNNLSQFPQNQLQQQQQQLQQQQQQMYQTTFKNFSNQVTSQQIQDNNTIPSLFKNKIPQINNLRFDTLDEGDNSQDIRSRPRCNSMGHTKYQKNSDLNIVYSNNSSKMLMDCKDNNQLKEIIFNLPNVKLETNQAQNSQQQQAAEDTQQDSRNKVSFESFRNINNPSPKSSEQKFVFNNQIVNSNNNNLSPHSQQSEKNNKSRYYINEEQSPIIKNTKGIQSMHIGVAGTVGTTATTTTTTTTQNQYSTGRFFQGESNNNSFQTIRVEKLVSNQVNLQSEIQKQLQKTQQYIHYNNMDNADSNMILNETTVFNSVFKKSNINYVQANQNNISSANPNNSPKNNLSFFPPNSTPNNSQHSIKFQMNNALGQQSNMNCYTPQNASKDRCNSFQFNQIANSIYGSTNIINPNTQINNTNNILNNNNNNLNNNNNNNLNNINSVSLKTPSQQQNQQLNIENIQQGSNININITQSGSTPNQTFNNCNPFGNSNCGTTPQNRKSSIQFPNGFTGGGSIYPQYSYMNFQVSQQNIEKGYNAQQENLNVCRELEISLFPSVVEGRAMMLVMLRDVTHRKYIQHLKTANIHKQQMVSYLSHELRNPLNCIINMLDTVEYDIQVLKKIDQNNVNVDDIENNISTALQNSKYILNLSNDYLDMARIKAAQFKLNIQPFNLLNLLKDCMKLFTIQAYKVNTEIMLKNITIKNFFFFDTNNQFQNMVYSDPERIKQVVINLISNALKFTHNGRIFLIAEYTTINSIQISIKDTGIGIEKSKIKSLFKAFGKVEDEENEQLNQQGVGLGLLISNMLSIQLSKMSSQQENSNNMTNTNSVLQMNTSTQSQQMLQQNQQQKQDKQEKGLKVESEKGIGSTFTLTVTDHNPYFKSNKTLARQAIQQITETQESSALLSQSLYENPIIKKSQFEKEISNNPTMNFKTTSNLDQQKGVKNSIQLVPYSQSQTHFAQFSAIAIQKFNKDGATLLIKNEKTSIIMDGHLNKANPTAQQMSIDQYGNNAQSISQISQIDLSENMNEKQSQFIISNHIPLPTNSPLKNVHKNNNNLNSSEPLTHSPLYNKYPIHIERIQKEYLIKSSKDIFTTVANTVKNNPSIKNKFKESLTSQNEQSHQTPSSPQTPNVMKCKSLSPLSSAQGLFPKQPKGRIQSHFSGQQVSNGEEDILIVDDSIFCCEALKNIIEKRFGMICMLSFSATRAVEAVKERFTNQKKEFKDKIKKESQSLIKDNNLNFIQPSIVLQSPIKREVNSNFNLSSKIVESEDTVSPDNRFFKFIFLDINMPDVNGFEGLYQIKSFLNQVYPNYSEKCQIIGCSGIDENDLQDQYHSNNNPLAQFDGFLFKPVLKEKLIEFFESYNISMIN